MSDLDPPPSSAAQAKAAPDSLALRAPPKPVTRLSRKALAALMGVSAVVIAGAGLWALRPPTKSAAKPDQYNTDHKPTAEGLFGLPTSYSGVTTTSAPSSPQPDPPKLGPPLPGDLGVPIRHAQEAGMIEAPGAGAAPGSTAASGMPAQTAADTVREQRAQEAKAALASGLFAATNTGASAGGAGETGLLATSTAVGAAPPASSPTSTGLAPHEVFLKPDADAEAGVVSNHKLAPPASPYVVMAGTTISAALVTGLNSDLPGQVIATVTAPVYDSPTGQILLIPQGARLLGAYDSGVGFGETRALLVWTRLILPDGSSVILDKIPATDAAGYAGVSDRVDNHWKQLVAGAALSTLIGTGAAIAAPENQTSGTNTVIVASRQGLEDSVNQVGQELTRKTLSVKPTLTVRPGYPVRILVNRDLVLRPYRAS
jgi:type IV secretion system protein VirB10